MSHRAYYNEIDEIACAVLRGTRKGYVDGRSIKDIHPYDLFGYKRAHFFAGAGLWQTACELAGWPDDLEIWTGSCPCQPFSVAGKGAGIDDPRHLWPDFFRLIRECRPGIVVGEQVGGKAGYGWLDGVRADLEAIGYACWAVDVPACSVDAPHRRNRIYWVAVRGLGDADCARANLNAAASGPRPATRESNVSVGAAASSERQRHGHRNGSSGARSNDANGADGDLAMADSDGRGRDGRPQSALGGPGRRDAAERADGELADSDGWDARAERQQLRGEQRRHSEDGSHPGAAGDGQRAENGRGYTDSAGLALGRGQRDDDGAQRQAVERADGQSGVVGDASASIEREPDTRGRSARTLGGSSFWADAEWLQCADGKARRAPGRTEPQFCVLADGLARVVDIGGSEGDPRAQIKKVDYSLLVQAMNGRADLWRLAGNSIVPQLAAEVLRALMEVFDGDA